MHFLAVALVYAAADSSKDSDTTLTGETQMHYLIAIAPLMTGFQQSLFPNILYNWQTDKV